VKVVIVGAGRLGRQLAEALVATGKEVTLVEIERILAEQVAATCPAHVLYGDAAEPTVLEEAGALKADVLAAVTGGDQVNLVVSLLAKRQFDVPRVVARVNEPENHWLFTDRWGVDVAVSASATVLSLIEEATSLADTVGLMRLGTAGVNLIETTITAHSSAIGKSVSEVGLPGGTMVAAVLRGGQPKVPSGSFTLEIGDELLVISEAATEADIHQVFQQ
jgi:trk system potassium uptake protein